MKLFALGLLTLSAGLWWALRCKHEMIVNGDKHELWLECWHCGKRTVGMKVGKDSPR